VKPTTREALELFVEKAGLLLGRSFVRFIRECGIKYTVQFSADAVNLSWKPQTTRIPTRPF
jgi:hypothetical protein